VTSEGSGPDLGALLSQLGQVQQNLQAAQQSATAAIVEGSAGGGAVKITATGGLDVQAVTIDPSVVDPADTEMLQDLVLAAVRDMVERANDLQSAALGGVGLGGGLEGLLGS
jgi:DNA-binding YbaB/EbfC family protein